MGEFNLLMFHNCSREMLRLLEVLQMMSLFFFFFFHFFWLPQREMLRLLEVRKMMTCQIGQKLVKQVRRDALRRSGCIYIYI
jgi:hypothetical protein